jgi:phage baseplate assembly protein W
MSEFLFDVNLEETPVLEPSDLEIVGEDIFLGPIEDDAGIEDGYGMSVTDHGDLAVVSGPKLAKQSVLRELINNPGSFPRRPQWGSGLPGLLFKGATQAVRDRITTRARARMLANPRVKRINEISTTVEETGVRLNVRVETLGGTLEDKIVIKPPGVS